MGRDYYWTFELESKSFLRVAEKEQDLLDSVIVENTKKERENNHHRVQHHLSTPITNYYYLSSIVQYFHAGITTISLDHS